ncbi:hypothetical protein CLV47_10416 [Antricoccus suffuscus]|uniref:Uncharacterized protein n=1 Tax=Antricoccus suffuscus TaxID=1629062 RepID=A0A2T1A248_9ACTN|nr:hypothetical protein [Antricoccus suffuscus]PRZ42672.1 hypothetical protein CLV47_10416 [Antricoccus suffuscus]
MTKEQSADNAQPSARSLWDRTPTAFKFGLVVAILGFFVSMTVFRSSSVNGAVVSCSYYNLGALAVALVVVVCAFTGFTDGRKRHPRLRPSSPWLYGGTVVLLALAAIHVARGFGIIGGGC